MLGNVCKLQFFRQAVIVCGLSLDDTDDGTLHPRSMHVVNHWNKMLRLVQCHVQRKLVLASLAVCLVRCHLFGVLIGSGRKVAYEVVKKRNYDCT